eukprot:TRINITY_DN5543_c0_g1_i1.p1 TRINITY_DN5543_c0_g1~~TRINITY_DN5543_c0_g1_i1.p1  ORF type:complete len:828 (+),score=126.38 TRINITY_DN5543_c0_g1_i1:1-2484(+)
MDTREGSGYQFVTSNLSSNYTFVEDGVQSGISSGAYGGSTVSSSGAITESIGSDPDDSSNDFYWNYEFQSSFDDVRSLGSKSCTYKKKEQIWHRLAKISRDFVYASQTYGRIIISEVNLPVAKKQIKPVQIQGFAGGEKYVVNSILFKFAIDNKGLFGGNELSAWKQAGQDLLCMNAYSQLIVNQLTDHNVTFPLCCLVDYRGFRLVCVSLIPIGPDSILYGTPDSGQNLFVDPEMEKVMDNMGTLLNIKKHWVTCRSRTSTTLMAKKLSSCADLEVHKGLDGRFYLLDFARAMPPQDTSLCPKIVNRHLTHKLRPEYVKLCKKPLNPDAFSMFIRFQGLPANAPVAEQELFKEVAQDTVESETEIREATTHMLNSHIPQVAKTLPGLLITLSNEEQRILLEDWLTVFIHFYGVNMRWIGAIRCLIPLEGDEYQQKWRDYLLIETVARIVKHQLNDKLRHTMRTSKTNTGEIPFISTVIDYLNQLFGTIPESEKLWEVIEKDLCDYFQKTLDHDNMDLSLKDMVTKIHSPDNNPTRNGLCILFDRICNLMGFQFRDAVRKLFSNRSDRFHVSVPFDDTDLIHLKENFKTNHVISHSQGVILKMRAQSAIKQEKDVNEYAQGLFTESLQEFRSSLQAVPQSSPSLVSVADVYMYLGKNGLAELFYSTAIQADEKESTSYFKYANFLHHVKCDYSSAEKNYSKSVELGKSISQHYLAYASFLKEIGQLQEAESTFNKALENFQDDSACHHAYANFIRSLSTNEQKRKLADQHFQLAIQHNPDEPDIILDYCAFLNEIGDRERSKEVNKMYQRLTKSKNLILQDSFRPKF